MLGGTRNSLKKLVVRIEALRTIKAWCSNAQSGTTHGIRIQE